MTIKNIIERIKFEFPDVPTSMLIKEIDNAQKQFAKDTLCLNKVQTLSGLSTNTSWALPSDFFKVKEVIGYNSNEEAIVLGDYDINYIIELGSIYFYSTVSTSISKIPDGISYIDLDYYYLPTTITAESDSLTVDEEFHEGIEYKVLERLFARIPIDMVTRDGVAKVKDMQMVRYYNGMYAEKRKEATRKRHEAKHEGWDILSLDYAGAFDRPKRKRGTVTSTIQATSDVYENFYAFSITDAGTVTSYANQIGYDTISVALTSNVITISSTAEFNYNTIVTTNQDPMGKTYESSSSIKLYPLASFGTLVVKVEELKQ